LTKCQRSSESALAQPTQEPVDPWSLMVHQVVVGLSTSGSCRRRGDFGLGASSKVQSSSVFGDGLQFRIRFAGAAWSFGGASSSVVGPCQPPR
jgi:hypothetical protein